MIILFESIVSKEAAFELIENLLEEAEESPDDSLNAIIEMLSRAIEVYKNQDDELTAFEKLVTDRPADLAVLLLDGAA